MFPSSLLEKFIQFVRETSSWWRRPAEGLRSLVVTPGTVSWVSPDSDEPTGGGRSVRGFGKSSRKSTEDVRDVPGSGPEDTGCYPIDGDEGGQSGRLENVLGFQWKSV